MNSTVLFLLVTLNDPDDETVLIEGVLFRARYLGSTQLTSECHPSKPTRMMQAQEAVGRIKVKTTHTTLNNVDMNVILNQLIQ